MTTRLTLICHAATAATRHARFPRDEEPDTRGLAEAVPDPGPKPQRWLAGPERRAAGTAAALCGGAAVAVDPALRDWDCGRWAGRDLAELQAEEPAAAVAWLSDPAAAPHGGESLDDLLARLRRWMAAEAMRGGRAAAVTHPAVLRAAVVEALGGPASAFWRIDVGPLWRVDLGHDGRRWALRGLVPPPGRR